MVVWAEMSVDDRPRAAIDLEDPPDAPAPPPTPGSDGEHRLQEIHGTSARARSFYTNQVRDHLLPTMTEFLRHTEMIFVATAASGRCRSTVSTGSPGFVHVVDASRLALPERRQGPAAGDVAENPHVGLLVVDFETARIGLHVNGAARVLDDDAARAEVPSLPEHPSPGDDAAWVLVDVEEAFIHCRKHIPTMTTLRRRE